MSGDDVDVGDGVGAVGGLPGADVGAEVEDDTA